MSPSPSTPVPTPAPAVPDSVKVRSFEVGHGECTLVEFFVQQQLAFRCLLDAGAELPQALLDHLKDNPRPGQQPDLDVLVLSHVDNDHQGGLPTLLEAGIRVGEYLSPCLPAFKRLGWLFADRVNKAVDRALAFERQALAKGWRITYPLEGYKHRYASNRVTLSIISPAAKLIKMLACGSQQQVAALVNQTPLPLQWLLEADEPFDEDRAELAALFDGKVMLSPDAFDPFPALAPPTSADPVSRPGAQPTPDFFGNSTLNDTSLIVVLDVMVDGVHRKRMLFPGDQENWTYVAAQHPAGLGIDVMKATHHGGRVYLRDQDEDLPGVYTWLRPKTVIVSANGQHELPRGDFRNVLRTVGGTLLCPHQRTFEALSAGAVKRSEQKSCFKSMDCQRSQGGSVTVTLTATQEGADRPACVQGTGITGIAPIVVLRQDVTVPSEGLLRYTFGELHRHASWLEGKLQATRRDFVKQAQSMADPFDVLAEQPLTSWRMLATLAKEDRRHDLVADPEPVLQFARSQHVFWSQATGRYASPGPCASLPSQSDLKSAGQWLRRIPSLLLTVESKNRFAPGASRLEILQHADWRVFDHLLAGKLKLAAEVIASEVRPTLLARIAKDYRFRVCSFRYPDSNYDGGKGYLLLQRAQASIPDLLSDPWMEVWKRYSRGSAQAPWTLLADLAHKEMLAGIYFDTPRHLTNPFENFTRDKYGSLASIMERANWITY
jgi:hypothetical protein